MKCVICKLGETRPGTVTMERGGATLVVKGRSGQRLRKLWGGIRGRGNYRATSKRCGAGSAGRSAGRRPGVFGSLDRCYGH